MINILFLAADPADATRLRLGEEVREIQEKLQLAKLRDNFALHQRFSVRPVDISQALLDLSPQIVHFSGHGTTTGAICIEDQLGNSHPIQVGNLAALFEHFSAQVNCVVLNACYSEAQARAIATYIDNVIGMNRAIGDRAAIAYSIGFYQALGAGRSIEEAYKLGCVQIKLQGIPESLTPVLIKKEVSVHSSQHLLHRLEADTIQTELISHLPPDSSEAQTISLSNQSAALSTQPIQNTPSIAVLPFTNVNADSRNESFCDGLTEELINLLYKIGGLKIAARASSFFFKSKDIHVMEIGRILNVNWILGGSVRKERSQLRISVELVNTADGYILWTECYERERQDISNVQNEIALKVAMTLTVELGVKEKTAILERYTPNIEAYDLYHEGRYYFYKHTAEGWLKAIEYFERAIEKDPNYALAYAGLSSVLAFPWYFGILPPHDAIPKWKAATSRALEIDNNLDEAHVALAQIHFFYEWDWKEAEREYRRAIELNPNNAYAHQQYGLFLAVRGRCDEAIREANRTVEIDPLSLFAKFQVGWIYFWSNRLDDAFRYARSIIEMEPNFYGGYFLMGASYMTRGEYEEAIGELQKTLNLGGGYHMLSIQGHAYGLLGKRDEALDILNQLIQARNQYYVTAIDIARAYNGLGENDKAFEWLETAYQERDGEMVYLKLETELRAGELWGKAFLTDPRFSVMLRRIRLTS